MCSGGRCVEAGSQVDTWEETNMLQGLVGAKKPYFCEEVCQPGQYCESQARNLVF